MNPLNLIPAPYRLLAIGIVLAAVAGVCTAGGYKLAAWHYKPALQAAQEAQGRAEDRAGQFEGAYNALAPAVGRCNASITALQDQAKAREARAAADIATAKATADIAAGAARDIMRTTAPPGMDQCQAAREAFDAELKQERGRP